jgi:HD superfamily phosphohydrolase
MVFFDPLLETVNFSREIVRIERAFQAYDKRSWGVFAGLVRTYEMSRLFFSKQAGLNFLKFPSATHNRFAHSIGCWMLGVKALEDVQVYRHNRFTTLLEWLDGHNKILEFLAALLLHDCGHGPFSHTLENNPWLDYRHDEISAQVIRGQGNYAQRIQQKAGAMPTVHQVLLDHGLDCELIALMIAGEEKDFRGDYAPFGAVRHLIEGDIDLDRLDHYQRDSFYMGTKLASFNIGAFLENIVLCPHDVRSRVRVTEEGLAHVMALLYAKEMIFLSGLDCHEIRSYETMLNHGVSAALQKGFLSSDAVPLLTEDELLYELKRSDDPEIQVPLESLLTRQPYPLAYVARVGPDTTRREIEDRLLAIVRRKGMHPYDVLVYIPFSERPKPADRWLNVSTLTGESLDDRFPGFSDMLSRSNQRRQHCVRFFAHTEEIAEDIHDVLQDEFSWGV